MKRLALIMIAATLSACASTPVPEPVYPFRAMHESQRAQPSTYDAAGIERWEREESMRRVIRDAYRKAGRDYDLRVMRSRARR